MTPSSAGQRPMPMLLLCLTTADAINNATLTPLHMLLAAACAARLAVGDSVATVAAAQPIRLSGWRRRGE